MIETLPTTRHYTPAAYARFLIPSILEGDDPALYLDGDIIVERDVALLPWNALGQYPIAAVQVASFSEITSQWSPELQAQFSTSPDTPYFGSGVMILNLKVWRERGYGDTLIEWAARWGSHTNNVDQDLMNICFAGNFLKLDDSWNFHISFPSNGEHYTLLFPALTHVSDALKPWMFPKHSARGLVRKFYRYLDFTNCPPPEEPLDDRPQSRGINRIKLWLKSIYWQWKARRIHLIALIRQARIQESNRRRATI